MRERGKLKLRKFYFHPVTMFIVMLFVTMLASWILSLFETQATYNSINVNTKELEPVLITIENMLSFDGLKFIISDAAKNFLSFAPLGSLLISLIGLTVAEGTGLIETVTRRHLSKMPKFLLTFIVIFLSTISSLINEVGYTILIPLIALVYFMNNRNPILGIVTAFCGVSFGYGVSIFVGSMEISLLTYTKNAALLIDDTVHVALTSNLFFIIAASIILSIVGTVIIEKIIAPKIGKYKKEDDLSPTEKYHSFDLEDEEQRQIEQDKYEKRGLRHALVVSILFGLFFIYALIPGLPSSGMLLDLKETAYVNQLFGANAYFQDGFTYLVSLFFIITGIAYGIGSKSIKNDKNIIENANKNFNNIGSVFILIFAAAQFIAVFRKSNIGPVVTSWLATALEHTGFSGIPLIITALIMISLANFVLTSAANKWLIFSPVVVPMFMQSNISPQFAQIIMRAGDSMTKGFTPLLASFVIFIGYLNAYNLNKNKPYTIKGALALITPYFLIIFVAWILLVVLWYLIGLPIGPGVLPTI
ncbi:MAG: AbgT family transporter [Bacilli bacterium]|nr:AbgT family transporter [Bacilli bacterium]